MILVRERAAARFARSAERPVTVVTGRAGSGKTTALRAYLATLEHAVVRFDVMPAHGSLTRFARGLAASLEPHLPQVGRSLAIAHERAMQSPRPGLVLAQWLAEHVAGARSTIAIDELHNADGNRAIAAFLAAAIARTRGDVRWILVTRSSSDLPLANWLAGGDADLPIDDGALLLTAEEAAALGRALAPGLDPEIVARAHAVARGVAGTFAFAVQTLARDPASAARLLDAGGDTFERFAAEVFAALSPERRRRLVEAAALPDLDEAFLEAAGLHEERELLGAVEAFAPQVFVRRDGRRMFHTLFAAELARRYAALDAVARRACATRAADGLERAGRIADALAYRLREGHERELVSTIEAHGFSLLESGYGDALQEAIDGLDPLLRLTSAVTLTIKAMAESRIGRFDTAESWFRLALDRAPEALRPQIGYQYGNHLVRYFRKEAVHVLDAIASDPDAGEDVRAYALAALGPAYVFERDIAAARRATDRALAIAAVLGQSHLHAKAHHQAAYVALYAGDALRARELAGVSLAAAEAKGYYDIAAGALTVLCNVATDLEDDPAESLRLLEAVGDCAAKSGSLVNQLFALVSMFEIRIEGGEESAAERIDEKLRTLDVTYGGRALYEALLPAQALRATWARDFAGAYHLLAESGEQPWSADRRALRHAEIAAYAAAAGFEDEAANAVRAAREALAPIELADLRVQRARLYLGLALTLLGRSEEAQETFDLVDAEPGALSARLRSLRRAFGALLGRFRGKRNHGDLLVSLVELDACGFGGIARFVAALPLIDNAMRRVKRLSVAERRAMLRWADGDEAAGERHLNHVLRKLDGADRGAVLRAVRWHRSDFETSRAESFGAVEGVEHAAS